MFDVDDIAVGVSLTSRCTRMVVLLVLLLSLVHHSLAYSSGAPGNACARMKPGHGVQPQTSSAPFTVTLSKNSLSPGETVQVSIKGSNKFKGFFLRVQQGSKYITGGQFAEGNDGKLRCDGEGVTHKSPSPKSTVKFDWTSPADMDASEQIQFVATVVQNFQTFWVKIPSDTIRVTASSSTSPSGSETTSASAGDEAPDNSSTDSSDSNGAVPDPTDGKLEEDTDNGASSDGWKHPGTVLVPDGCGEDIGCFHDCDTGACSFAITWKPQGDSIRLRMMYRTTSNTDQWIAIGLSKDKLMGDDSVMECVMDKDKVLVKTSYNEGKFNDYPDDKEAAMKDFQGSVVNGVLACEVTRLYSYPREPKVFDLRQSYYLLVASGEAVAGNKFPHSYASLPFVSKTKVSLSVIGNVEEGLGSLYPMVKTHGTAMVIGWVLFANIGIFIARNGRKMLSSSKPCGKDVWFHIHRFCMTMTLLLTLTGFCLILIEAQGRSHIPEVEGKSYVTLHPPLGLIVIILTIVNPLMAAFRPEMTSPSRPLFRWTHWGFGVFAWFVSFIVLIIGLNLDKAHAETEAIYILFAFIGYSIVMEVVVRVLPYTCGAFRACCSTGLCDRSNSYDLSMETYRHAEVVNALGSGLGPDKEAANEELARITRTKNAVRSTILIIHMLACVCFTVGVLFFSLRKSVHHVIAHHE